MDDELLTTDEVAARLRATPRFVRRLVSERRIEFVKVGRLVRFEIGAVTAYIDLHRVQPVNRTEQLISLRRAA